MRLGSTIWGLGQDSVQASGAVFVRCPGAVCVCVCVCVYARARVFVCAFVCAQAAAAGLCVPACV